MATHIKRTQTSHQEVLILHGGARVVSWARPGKDISVHEIEHLDPAYGRGRPLGLNFIRPPYHWHWYQDEFFVIKQGTIIFTLEGRDFKAQASNDVIHIPARARHTFMPDPEADQQAIVEFTTTPGGSGMSEKFFRNLYTYLDDCEKPKVAPSLPQLLLFIDSAEASLAFPGPGFIARPISWAFGVIFGRWLGSFLGYKASYEEYYDPKMAKKA